MATRRYSVNPQDNDHQITDAVGAAVVTKAIELTVDWDALIALTPSMSEPQRRMQVTNALINVINYIETSGKYNVAG